MKYPKTIIDEASGIEVPNSLYEAYQEGESIGFTKGLISKVNDLSLLNEDEMNELNTQAQVYFDAIEKEGMRKVVNSITTIMDCRYSAETFAIKVCDVIEAKIKEINNLS